MSEKHLYQRFLMENFKGLKLIKPLFYNWPIGLRFDLQTEHSDLEWYFEEVIRRASTLFEAVFAQNDDFLLIYRDYKYKRHKIRISEYVLTQIDHPDKNRITFSREKRLYWPNDADDLYNVAIIKTSTGKVNYRNILKAIGNTDFPDRKPVLDDRNMHTSKEVFFLHMNKKIIFQMYDDRGLDIIAADKETLRPLYNTFNSWILEYDRKMIEALLENA